MPETVSSAAAPELLDYDTEDAILAQLAAIRSLSDKYNGDCVKTGVNPCPSDNEPAQQSRSGEFQSFFDSESFA
ncbi:hypothetical protein [Coleofasciculus sp. F4-SAH-05]|uniref:hypothetical protein n=1 Tax=Coleofasciculus sp. F4-SAH-05 TaxID=3069525 RepID=UPI0032F42A37